LKASDHITYMRHALRLAERGLGIVAPNPSVGCLIVAGDGRILGRGWTQRGGRPHAETVALAEAGDAARGATAYVTLEPCAHHGQTPPCADALIAAGIARAVIATPDPDPRVNGRGSARLSAAGIDVAEGVCADDAKALNQGFFTRVTDARPMVALKIAQSADGFVADAQGHSRWITSDLARRHGHYLRATHDAIMVGIRTVLTDDPLLTCRVDGLEDRSPVRVVLDRDLRLPLGSQLVATARLTPVIVFTVQHDGGDKLRDAGVEVVSIAPDPDGLPDIAAVLHELAKRGITRLIAEGGPTVHATLLRRSLADRLHVYRAPLLLGAGARSAIARLETGLEHAPKLRRLAQRDLGPDLLESFAVSG
jgi:diaminohydroxyphosphoribosylaminopyrimidine deaminase/5-amino-6-(5-phosphoribosylamino)uracil reductase